MQLSKRLYAVAQLAAGTKKIADVGTDHGYIPIYLVEEEGAEYAIAMDLKEGPLKRARENIRLHGLEEKIAARLSDGVEALRPGEADTVVIAGMGGALTIHILEKGEEILSGVENLVLQPQSEIHLVRKYLHEKGYEITVEDMVKDEGKYYPMMKAKHGEQKGWKDYEYRWGKYMIEQKNPVLKEFLEREYHTYEKIREELKKQQGEHIGRRLKEVEEKLGMMEKAKESMR